MAEINFINENEYSRPLKAKSCGYTLLGVVTTEEIVSIDKRIKSCIVENKEEPDDEIYVKIWFNYSMGDNTVKTDGRQEFVADTKETLIEEIQDFLKVSKDGWCIL